MSPFKSSKGRNLGKMLEGFKSSDIGKGFGGGGVTVKATGGTKITTDDFTYHIFNEFVAAPYMEFTANTDLTCDWLVLGAGGGGSVQHSAGAGAGGVRSSHGPGGPNPSPEAQVTLFGFWILVLQSHKYKGFFVGGVGGGSYNTFVAKRSGIIFAYFLGAVHGNPLGDEARRQRRQFRFQRKRAQVETIVAVDEEESCHTFDARHPEPIAQHFDQEGEL